jgi:hypothetical protein
MRSSQGLKHVTAAVLAATLYALPLPAMAEQGCTTGKLPFACKSEKIFDRIAEIKDDQKAVQRLMVLAVAAGECSMLDSGKTVFIEDRTWFTERRKVRIEGELTSFWVLAGEVANGACEISTPSVSGASPQNPQIPISPAVTTHYPVGPSNVKPIKAGKSEESPACEFKPVMTDEEMARCRPSH